MNEVRFQSATNLGSNCFDIPCFQGAPARPGKLIEVAMTAAPSLVKVSLFPAGRETIIPQQAHYELPEIQLHVQTP